MKKILKQFWPHLISYVLVIVLLIMFYPIIYGNIDLNDTITPSMIVCLIIEFLCVIGVWGEIFYFITKIDKEENLKHDNIHMVLIYSLNIFYIPCFNIKYICKDKHSLIKNIIYLLTIIPLFIILVIFMFKFAMMPKYETYTSHDKKFEITLLDKYDLDSEDENELYFEGYEENISVSSFGKDYTVDQILNILEADGYDTEPDFKLIEKKEKEIDNKNIKYNTYSFNYNGDKNIVTYSTITFDEDSEYIIVFSQTSIEEAYDEEELFDIYKSIELKE